ncbi:pyranose oxidase [Gigaspora margarita]|uniref:Pyranose oxidase n=1 Tax=Gigaspora margarita TaxID=4874 RepID=A0A8H3WYY2_GIGMA|nr:pyranose oxidase [Gigaspora margarita]
MNLKIFFRLSIIFFAFIDKAYTLSKNEDLPIKNFDAVIVGSGPLGSTYARKLIEAGYKVAMVEVGASESNPPGLHLLNAYRYQVDPGAFDIKSQLHFLSVPTSEDAYPETLDQTSTFKNGLRGNERFNNLVPEDEMDKLYEEAETYLHTSQDPYNHTMLQTTVLKALKMRYDEEKSPRALPVAVRYKKGDDPDEIPFYFWTGSHDILRKENFENKNFVLIEKHLAQILQPKIDNTSIIDGLIIKDLFKRGQNEILIKAKVFIICAGAVNTPQLLYNSMIKNSNWDIEIPALGKNLCDQTMANCQIVLNKEIVEKMLEDPAWSENFKKHKETYPNDPVPIPFGVPGPQCSIPYTDKRPWYCEVFRDSGDTSYVNNRVTLGFNCYGAPQNSEELNNRVEFSKKNKYIYGMPQPTFYVRTSKKDAEIYHKMFSDMTQTALSMGGFLPGGEPTFLPPGFALHMTGTVRMGTNKETSVVDTNLCVHGFRNLYLGTNGIIPTAITANPALTSVALAIKSANDIIKKLKEGAFDF